MSNAHEQIDREIHKDSILGAIGKLTNASGHNLPKEKISSPAYSVRDRRTWTRPNIFDEAKTPEGKKILDKINKMNKMGMGKKAIPKTPIIAALLGGYGIGTALDEQFDLSGKLAEWLMPDPKIDINTTNKQLEQIKYGKLYEQMMNLGTQGGLLKESLKDSLMRTQGSAPFIEGIDNLDDKLYREEYNKLYK